MEELILTRGNTKPIDFDFLDDQDLPENLSTADKAQFQVKETWQSTVPVFVRDTDSGNLSIDVPNSRIIATLTLSESEALTVGLFVGQLAVRFGTEDDWYYTDVFRVRFEPNVAERI